LFPILVLFPVIATLFGLYGKVKRLFVGMDIIEDEEDNAAGYGTGNWREGRDLIDRELGGNSLLRRREEAIARLNASGNLSGRAAPVLSIPAARGSSNSPARSPIRPSAHARRAGQSSRTALEEPVEDENFLQLLGHRMKNTVDTFETPKWLQDIGQGITNPKWMAGNGDEAPSGNTSGGNNSSDFRRWFGGGDGHVRL
jgi:hypothetical protein